MAETTPNLIVTLPDTEQNQPDINRLLIEAIRVVANHNHESGKGLKVPNSRVEHSSDTEVNNNKIKNIASSSYSNIEPDVVENNSVFFREGDLYVKDNLGRVIQITKNGQVNNLILDIESGDSIQVYYGFGRAIGAPSRDITRGEANVVSAATVPANRTEKTMNSLLIGGRFRITAPNVSGAYYWPFLAIKKSDLQNSEIFYTTDFENQTNFWHKVSLEDLTIDSEAYDLYYYTISIGAGETLDCIIRTFL